MHLRALKKYAHEVSLFEPIGIDKEGNEVTLIDVLGTEPDAVAEVVERGYDYERVKHHLSGLHDRERQVLELRYGILGGLRRTQREIARRLGISRSYVSRIEKKAIQKLIQELERTAPDRPAHQI
ncbi:MAG: sigma-70 family RNA polymerase sigma factor [Clostridia bacterium]|jgi:RNA polymerase sporulation-specific sigma factor|nr:sigma-70 family RNA polymerase sigma factor [Clostridia bacterium]